MFSDIEIAQTATLMPIVDIARSLDISTEKLIPFGHYMAKLSLFQGQKPETNTSQTPQQNAKLILVTAISPTPAGEGKTTTTIGLADALSAIGKKAIVCIREPSLGPVFGLKGGATGGGYAQVVPMENINLHFTGDFHAITAANNLLAALIDNHIYHGNALSIQHITWQRCLDMNDRALRKIQLNHQDKINNQHGETGFDITVASEVMAIFCLAGNLDDLKNRLGRIQIATNHAGKPVLASDLQAEGAMTALLKDAFLPNLVQTLEHTPAIVHGGPFANIAHGCNSVVATKAALNLADYVVTEAGFGADLGAEKFFDIKCRQANLAPDLVVIVATVRALKYHGGAALSDLNHENIAFLLKGMCNLERHVENCRTHFGLQVIVAINHFVQDTEAEITTLIQAVAQLGCKAIVCKHWAKGGAGATDLAQAVVKLAAQPKPKFKFLYDNNLPILQKIEAVASKIYGAKSVNLSLLARQKLQALEEQYVHFPVCIAKTQYSFSSDATLRGAPKDHVLQVEDVRLSRGAGFIVVICGNIMTMPGLPKVPASARISMDSHGKITGLS